MWLAISNLGIRNEEKIIFENANLELTDRVVALYGANGIGKSTLFNVLYKYQKFVGEINIIGQDLDKLSNKQVRKMVSYAMQEPTIFEEWTVSQNLKCMQANIDEYSRYFKQFMIKDYEKKKMKDLSGGERQVINICFALAKNSEIVLLDEPFNNLSETNSQVLKNIISQDKRKFIIVSHEKLDGIVHRAVSIKGRDFIV